MNAGAPVTTEGVKRGEYHRPAVPFTDEELTSLRSRWEGAAPDLIVPRLLATLEAERTAHKTAVFSESDAALARDSWQRRAEYAEAIVNRLCECTHGSAGNRMAANPDCPVHHEHRWEKCPTCGDGSHVCYDHPVPHPHKEVR